MKFYHHPHIKDGKTLHIFSGFAEHGSQVLSDFDNFVAEHDMDHEKDWSMKGMSLTAYTDDPRLATLFKLTL